MAIQQAAWVALLAAVGCSGAQTADMGADTDGVGTTGGPEGEDGGPAPEASCDAEEVGFVPIQRLTREQYANTVRDLLYLDVDVRGELPDDVSFGGFDNNAEALGMSPTHVDAFYSLAKELSAEVVHTEASFAQLASCSELSADCQNTVVRTLLERAWRRPVEESELAPYVALFQVAQDTGGGFEDGFALIVETVLMSPNFLFRMELDPDPNDTSIRSLTSFEMASRLSYFLWNTMPDDALFAAARDESLLTEEGLRDQVERMLASEKAVALIDSFAAQWLGFNEIESFNVPNPELYPQFEQMLPSMQTQTRLTMLDYIFGWKSFGEFLTDPRTFVDPLLAEYYGVQHPTGSGFAPVDIQDPDRRGFLTQPSVLTMTSHSSRTSPVKRGFWVMANLLCQEPPPPPDGAETELPGPDEVSSLREALEQHRADPACASCHVVMDEIGFGFEHYDVMGYWRETDSYGQVDASGVLPDPTGSGETVSFYGVAELSEILQRDPRLPKCISEKAYAYALNRLPYQEDGDACRIDEIASDFSSSNHNFLKVLDSIVFSDAFRFRHAEP